MVERTLSTDLINDGATLVAALDKMGVRVKAAVWYLFSDTQTWRLVLEIGGVQTMGPRAAYKKVQSALTKIGTTRSGLSLDEVAIARANAPIIQLLRLVVKTGSGIHGVRFTGNVINGQLIDDAYIYRLT